MNQPASQQSPRTWIQPLDQAAIAVMVILSIAIVGLLWGGHPAKPKVRDFSWQSQTVGAGDTAFVLTFNRPMDHASVEENLLIGPPLPGRFSWSGQRMVYTLNAPAPYGSQYQVALQNAQEQFTGSKTLGDSIKPFSGQFQTRDRSFIYIGISGEEDGCLVLYNLTRQRKSILTPAYLVVQDFQIDPTGQTIHFLASDRTLAAEDQLYGQKLYRIPATSGSPEAINASAPSLAATMTPPEQILDNRDYVNQKIQISPDGQRLVVQRVKKSNPSEVGLWLLEPDQPPKPLNTSAGGEFRITADSQSIAIAQGEGVSLLPLTAEPSASPANGDTQFLAKFAKVLDFSRDGRYAATIKFNPTEYTRSLFVLDSQQGEKEYFKTKGSILQARFDPTGRYLYCLLTELVTGKTYREQPYFAVVDLQAAKLQPLLLLPEQRDMQVSLSPDGLVLLFDQLVLSPNNAAQPTPIGSQRIVEGRVLQTSYQWILPLVPSTSGKVRASQPQRLPLLGLHPQWVP